MPVLPGLAVLDLFESDGRISPPSDSSRTVTRPYDPPKSPVTLQLTGPLLWVVNFASPSTLGSNPARVQLYGSDAIRPNKTTASEKTLSGRFPVEASGGPITLPTARPGRTTAGVIFPVPTARLRARLLVLLFGTKVPETNLLVFLVPVGSNSHFPAKSFPLPPTTPTARTDIVLAVCVCFISILTFIIEILLWLQQQFAFFGFDLAFFGLVFRATALCIQSQSV